MGGKPLRVMESRSNWRVSKLNPADEEWREKIQKSYYINHEVRLFIHHYICDIYHRKLCCRGLFCPTVALHRTPPTSFHSADVSRKRSGRGERVFFFPARKSRSILSCYINANGCTTLWTNGAPAGRWNGVFLPLSQWNQYMWKQSSEAIITPVPLYPVCNRSGSTHSLRLSSAVFRAEQSRWLFKI